MIIVTNTNDSGAGSLRQAVLDAASGEEITFSVTGTITLTSGEILIAQDLTITGPGSGSLIISGNNTSRIFKMEPPGIITITGLTLQEGSSTDGGALHNTTVLTLADIIIQNCAASNEGGGIWNNNTLTTTGDLTISGCTASGNGGGIHNGGTLDATNVVLTENVSPLDGAGIYNGGTFTCLQGTVNDNDGDGIGNSGTVTIDRFTINGNALGIYNDAGSITVTRSTVSHSEGNGVFAVFGNISFENSTCSSNEFNGFNNSGGTLEISNSTIVLNVFRGILNADGGFCTIYDTIVVGNGSPDIQTLAVDFESVGHNIFGSANEVFTLGAADQSGFSFAMVVLGPLQNNGGTTMTHALLEGSPAINSGDNSFAPATDQRGDPRIVGGTIDIGAYESDFTETCLEVIGELPSWAQVEGNCIVAKPGLFFGATKAEANAKAQAALETYYAAALASGDVTCEGPAPFPPTVTVIAITGINYPYQSTVDPIRNRFWTSWGWIDAVEFMTIVDCSTDTLLASPSPPNIPYGIQYVPTDAASYPSDIIYCTTSRSIPTSGTIDTFNATTWAQTVGVFTFALTSGKAGPQLWIDSKRKLFYSRQRQASGFFLMNLGVIDFATETQTEWTASASGGNIGASSYLHRWWYNPTLEQIYMGIDLDTPQKLYIIDVNTLARITGISPPSGKTWVAGGGSGTAGSGLYCEDNDKMYVAWRESASVHGFSIINATTNAIETTVTLPDATLGIWDMIYRQNLQQVYIFTLDDKCHAIDITKYNAADPNEMIIGSFATPAHGLEGTSCYNSVNGKVYVSAALTIFVID